MLYAARDGATTLIVAAADQSATELDDFYAQAVQATHDQRRTPRLFEAEFQPTISDMLLDPRFAGFKRPPFVFEFNDAAALEQFAAQFGIRIGQRAMVLDRQLNMLAALAVDPYLSPQADQRPIGEIHGLDALDPWDRRSEEQKAKDEIARREAEENKKAGKLSGDSFGRSQRRKIRSSVTVTDIHSTLHEDGSIEIDDVLAVKGLDDNPPSPESLDVTDPSAARHQAGAEHSGQADDQADGRTDGQTSDQTSAELSQNPAANGDAPSAMSSEPVFHFVLPEGFRPRAPNNLPALIDLDDCLEVLGDLPPYPQSAQAVIGSTDAHALQTRRAQWHDRRGRLIVVQDSTPSPQAQVCFSVGDTRLAHRLAYLLDATQISYAATIIERDPALPAAPAAFTPDAAIAQYITPGGYIAIYHRVDVPAGAAGQHLWQIISDLEDAGEAQGQDLLALVAARGQMSGYCWLACVSKAHAETIAAVLAAKLAEGGEAAPLDVYGVNDLGERLAPKGIELVEASDDVEPPRPWNDRAAEWNAMDATARQEESVRLRGKEFIFCGSYHGPAQGCICYLTPRRYFNTHGVMWDQSLDIKLPDDLKEVEPGVYRTRSRDWLNLAQDLNRRGMSESLALQLYINGL